MGLVHIDNLMPGLILAADVHDRNGRLLLGTDTELTDKHIHIFRTWGVLEVDITGVEENTDAHTSSNIIDSKLWAEAESEIKPLFRYTDLSHPAILELLRICILRKAQHGIR